MDILVQLVSTLGSGVMGARQIGGGDINKAACVELADGRRVFIKHNSAAPVGMFAAEARDLAWLAETGTVRVPRVIAHMEGWLALEWIERGAPTEKSWEQLGQNLAALHRAGAPRFGGPEGWIATLPQAGGDYPDWATLYGEGRLYPQLRLMVDLGFAQGRAHRIEALIDELPERVGPPEPPARLHGDLWRGNMIIGEDGAPVVVDPASYAGHREVDLAMMRLFGGFPERCFAACFEAWPLEPGWRERVPLYQLYFLMVHVNLFGEGWLGRVDACLDELGVG